MFKPSKDLPKIKAGINLLSFIKKNGETVLEYHLWTDDWNEMVKDSKFPELNPDWANVPKEGYIALQDHGDDVWFRGIKIKEL